MTCATETPRTYHEHDPGPCVRVVMGTEPLTLPLECLGLTENATHYDIVAGVAGYLDSTYSMFNGFSLERQACGCFVLERV